jgi:hypothetical protein
MSSKKEEDEEVDYDMSDTPTSAATATLISAAPILTPTPTMATPSVTHPSKSSTPYGGGGGTVIKIGNGHVMEKTHVQWVVKSPEQQQQPKPVKVIPCN